MTVQPGSQLDRVTNLMADGQWRTLGEIATAVVASEASVSTRLRDLRKPIYGAWALDRRARAGTTINEYRLTPGAPS